MVCRKFIFVALLLSFFVSPLQVLSTETRGMEPTSSDLQDSIYLGNYHALIIGINNYKEWNPLKTAVKDAQALKQILIERYGFKKELVVLRTDDEATRQQVIGDLRNIASSLGPQDNLLIYYAGHGQLDDLTGDGYWVPVEGGLKTPSTWISHSTIKNILSSERVRGKNIVVIADSCYSGTLLRGGPSLLTVTEEGYYNKLLKAANRRSRQVIASGGLEPVADGGRDGHSLFAYYFLKALKENNQQLIDLENLFHTNVWKPVTEIGGQRPNVGRLKTPMDEDGQFVLVNSNTTSQPLAFSDNKKEELKLASQPKSIIIPRISLREKPLMIKDETKINNMLLKYDFFELSINPLGAFENLFVDNNDGTVTDKATGLMWQKSGSDLFDYKGGEKYIEQVNIAGFAGYSDWRIPSIEELASLLARREKRGVHLDPVFDNMQTTCWSADQYDPKDNSRKSSRSRLLGRWIVSFKQGQVLRAIFLKNPPTGAMEVIYNHNDKNCVKAVRTVN